MRSLDAAFLIAFRRRGEMHGHAEPTAHLGVERGNLSLATAVNARDRRLCIIEDTFAWRPTKRHAGRHHAVQERRTIFALVDFSEERGAVAQSSREQVSLDRSATDANKDFLEVDLHLIAGARILDEQRLRAQSSEYDASR